jgi:hypothetical protein
MMLEELLASKEFWLETFQNELFRAVLEYQTRNDLDKKQLAVALGCTPRMTTELLNGSIDCSMSKMMDIVTRMKLCPNIQLTSLHSEVETQKQKCTP